MYLSCPIDPPEVRLTPFDSDPSPRDPEDAPSNDPLLGGVDSELEVWSSGTLVAIVRRRQGRTVEVIRVAGEG